jgi:hypothetical protein
VLNGVVLEMTSDVAVVQAPGLIANGMVGIVRWPATGALFSVRANGTVSFCILTGTNF